MNVYRDYTEEYRRRKQDRYSAIAAVCCMLVTLVLFSVI
jgi:hypothetical protein